MPSSPPNWRAGDLAEAVKTAAQIKFDATKEECYAMILPAQLEAGDIAGAKETAAELGDERDDAEQGIAEAQARAGDVAGAKETAGGSPTSR